MDALLNGILFKCFLCKLLTKIVHRDSVSPDNNQMMMNNNYFLQREIINDREIKNLFNNNINLENNTPIRNLFYQGIGFNNNQMTYCQPLPGQNLMENFNRSEGNRFNDILQTPKTISKFDRDLLFSPDHLSIKTPMSTRNEKPIEFGVNLKDLGFGTGFSTPKTLNRSQNFNTLTNDMEEGLNIHDFDEKLQIQTKQAQQKQQQQNNLNYSLLSSKKNNNRLSCRGMNTKNEILIEPKKSIFKFFISRFDVCWI
jgi:hypothetical protein